MMFGGKSMGGGGGGSVLRSAGRAVTRASFAAGAHQDAMSGPTSPRHVSGNGNGNGNGVSNLPRLSSPFASCSVPVPVVSATWPQEVDWVTVEDEYFLNPVPSEEEVHSAVSALQQVFIPESYNNRVRDKFGSEFDNDEEHQVMNRNEFSRHVSPVDAPDIDWIEPSVWMCDPRLVQCERVSDAFHLLRTEPIVQKMVKSLSSDSAVWNAVMNNEVVRELRESFFAEGSSSNSEYDCDAESGEETSIAKSIFLGARGKLMEAVEKITRLVSDLFQFLEDEKTGASEAAGPENGAGSFKEKLRTSFMLSVMVLLVVVVARANKT